MPDMLTTESLWRCTECGKWSHAKRKPKHHQRFVLEEPEDDSKIISCEPVGLDDDGGWYVACGPFEEWIASRVDLARLAGAQAWDEGVATALNHAVRQDDGITLRLEHFDGRPWENPYRLEKEARG